MNDRVSQAAEKALKAVLAFADAPIPRTHNLEARIIGASPPGPPQS